MYGVLNTLLGAPPVEKSGHRFQWMRVGERWLTLKDGKSESAWNTESETDMHVGLHYERQSNRESALFSRSAIPAGSKFTAWVRDERGAIRNPPSEIFLGRDDRPETARRR